MIENPFFAVALAWLLVGTWIFWFSVPDRRDFAAIPAVDLQLSWFLVALLWPFMLFVLWQERRFRKGGAR